MTRNDAILAIHDLLGGTDRAAAERVADTLHAEHARWEDVITAARAMDDAAFFALAAGGNEPNFLRFEGPDDDRMAVYLVRY